MSPKVAITMKMVIEKWSEYFKIGSTTRVDKGFLEMGGLADVRWNLGASRTPHRSIQAFEGKLKQEKKTPNRLRT